MRVADEQTAAAACEPRLRRMVVRLQPAIARSDGMSSGWPRISTSAGCFGGAPRRTHRSKACGRNLVLGTLISLARINPISLGLVSGFMGLPRRAGGLAVTTSDGAIPDRDRLRRGARDQIERANLLVIE